MTPSNELIVCNHCHLLVDEDDFFCRHCGCSLKPGYNFCYSHTGIILLALVLGPFVLPLVWMSKRIGLTAKIIYSVVLVAFGLYFILLCYRLYQFTWDLSRQIFGGLGNL